MTDTVYSRMETSRLILRKAVKRDLQQIWKRVWSNPRLAEYMYWSPTYSFGDAVSRLYRTMRWQKKYPYTYFVEEKASHSVIGFIGMEETTPHVFSEIGICIAEEFQKKGYATEALTALMRTAFDSLSADVFRYSYMAENLNSKGLSEKMGFTYVSKEKVKREKDGILCEIRHTEMTKEEYLRKYAES